MTSPWFTVFRDAAVVVALSTVLALVSNWLHPTTRIPLVAEREYQVLVPCPEFEGKAATAISPADLRSGEGTMLVDAREEEAFKAWHAPGAVCVPYDYLEPTPTVLIAKVLEARARRVVVYGDGDDPDSGQQLANELSGKGIRNVSYVKGGAPLLKGAGKP